MGSESGLPPAAGSSGPAQDGRTAPAALPSGNDPAKLVDARALGWNWAAFLMPYPWLLGHGRVTWGMILLLSLGVPLVGFLHILVYPVVAMMLGNKGYEIAWTHAPYHSVAQLREGEREWVVWGIVYKVLLVLGFLALAFYFWWLFRTQPELMELYREMTW